MIVIWLFEQCTAEKERSQKVGNDDGLEEEMSEAEDDRQHNPGGEIADGDESSDEEDDHTVDSAPS